MLTRWDPFDEMDRLTGRFFRDSSREQRGFAPSVDIFENDGEIELRAELPGVKSEDVHLDVTDNVLTVSGERKLEHEEEREGYRRIERSYGKFTRSFTLPRNVDQENIRAEMREGILHVTLPKREEQKARRIEIGGGKEEKKEVRKGERRAQA